MMTNRQAFFHVSTVEALGECGAGFQHHAPVFLGKISPTWLRTFYLNNGVLRRDIGINQFHAQKSPPVGFNL